MEVDQVQAKGKASPKGNKKAKRAVGLVCHMVANTVEIRRVEAKENQSTKEKKGNKGKNKGKQQKGKGYGGGNSSNTCRLCNVNQVGGAGNPGEIQGAPNDVASTTGSTSTRRANTSSTTSQSLSSGSKSVRLVKMYHVATPPAEHPEVFELRSDLEGDEQDEWYVRMVSDTSTLWFQLDSGENDHPGELRWSNDPLMDWYHGLLCTLDWRQGVHDEDENLYIRAVPAGQLVVLDSGVDISLLPYHLSGCGIPKSGGETILENAQGERPQAFGKRSARVECEGLSNDLVVIEDDFIVVSVQSALISIGRLLHRGWSLRPNSRAGAMLTLVSPDGEAEVPLEFKRNSMAVCASIQVVSARDASSTSTSTSASMARLPKQPKQVPEPKLGKIIEEENDMMAIQTVIIRKEELTRHILRRGLNTSSSGNPFIDLPQSKVGLLSS